MSRRFYHSLRSTHQRQLSSFRFRPNKPNRCSASFLNSPSGLILTTTGVLQPRPTNTHLITFKLQILTYHRATAKMASSPPQRTYNDALSRLAQLQSNRTIVNLFGPSNDNNDPSSSKKLPAGKGLNSLAIPEMLSWLSRAGYTPSSLAATGLKCVHVAGTKGKGSVSALVSSIISQYPSSSSGPVVGTYTSPHVLSVRERIQLDGTPISHQKFAQYFFEVWDRLSQAAREAKDPVMDEDGGYDGPGTKPFYFRFLTILAFHVFVREGVKSAVIECGIGGEYDSTNFLAPESVTASVVTQLGIDHVAMLGDTLEKIAWNKSGIFRRGVKGFTRRLDNQGGVMEVLRERAREKGCEELVEVEDREVEEWKGVQNAKLEGPFQKYNMALAVKAAREHLIRTGHKFEGRFGEEDNWKLDDIPAEFLKGLKEASLKGRCESFRDSKGTEWFVDGAHTEDSLAGVGQWFAGKVKEGDVNVLVFNQQDRDPEVLLRALLTAAQKQSGTSETPVFSYAVFTRNEEKVPAEGEQERDLAVQLKGQKILQETSTDTKTSVYNAVEPAMEQIQKLAEQARKDGRTCNVLVTGSFHLLGGVLKTVEYVEY